MTYISIRSAHILFGTTWERKSCFCLSSENGRPTVILFGGRVDHHVLCRKLPLYRMHAMGRYPVTIILYRATQQAFYPKFIPLKNEFILILIFEFLNIQFTDNISNFSNSSIFFPMPSVWWLYKVLFFKWISPFLLYIIEWIIFLRNCWCH